MTFISKNINSVSNELWTRPVIAHANDEEFETELGSEWELLDSGAAANEVPIGTGVDTYDSTFTAGDCRVDVNLPTRPSWVLIQPPNSGGGYILNKSIGSLPTNLLCIARMKFNLSNTLVAEDATLLLTLGETSASKFNSNNEVGIFIHRTNGGTTKAQTWKRVSGTPTAWDTTADSADVDREGQALEYVALHKIGSTFHAWVGTNAGGWIWMGKTSPGAVAPDRVGIALNSTTNGAPGPMVVGVDFIRFIETDNFLY